MITLSSQTSQYLKMSYKMCMFIMFIIISRQEINEREENICHRGTDLIILPFHRSLYNRQIPLAIRRPLYSSKDKDS